MLQITCPWCGPRNETEFSFGGESHIIRPVRPESISDRDWSDYQFLRENPKGTHYERWQHRFGCRQWINVARDTLSHEIYSVYPMGDPKPVFDRKEALL